MVWEEMLTLRLRSLPRPLLLNTNNRCSLPCCKQRRRKGTKNEGNSMSVLNWQKSWLHDPVLQFLLPRHQKKKQKGRRVWKKLCCEVTRRVLLKDLRSRLHPPRRGETSRGPAVTNLSRKPRFRPLPQGQCLFSKSRNISDKRVTQFPPQQTWRAVTSRANLLRI